MKLRGNTLQHVVTLQGLLVQCLGKAHRRSVRKKQLCNKLYTATHIKHAATYIHHTTAHIHHAALHRNTLQHNASVARACRLWCCNTRTTHCNIHTSHRDTPRHTASHRLSRPCLQIVVLQHTYSTLQHTYNTLQHAATHCLSRPCLQNGVLQHNSKPCNVHISHCNTTTTHCNTHTSHYNTQRHTASIALACRLGCCTRILPGKLLFMVTLFALRHKALDKKKESSQKSAL